MEHKYKLHLHNYDGPLDLLLKLVKSKRMDLFSIDLAELAFAYLKLINQIKEKNIDIASEYLVMTATLLQLKAMLILKTPKDKEVIQKSKKNILKQLAEYQQFKILSKSLRKQEKKRQEIFIKNKEDCKEFEKSINKTKLEGSLNISKLTSTLKKMFERTRAKKFKSKIISRINISAYEITNGLRTLLKSKNFLVFESLFNVRTLKHFLVTWLAILDMARSQEIIIKQTEQFGIISIIKKVKDE